MNARRACLVSVVLGETARGRPSGRRLTVGGRVAASLTIRWTESPTPCERLPRATIENPRVSHRTPLGRAKSLPALSSDALTLRASSSTGQRAFPNPDQQFFELAELLRPELNAPLAFDVLEDPVDFRVGGTSALGQADNSRAAFIQAVGPRDIPEAFEAPQQLIHGLFTHA